MFPPKAVLIDARLLYVCMYVCTCTPGSAGSCRGFELDACSGARSIEACKLACLLGLVGLISLIA